MNAHRGVFICKKTCKTYKNTSSEPDWHLGHLIFDTPAEHDDNLCRPLLRNSLLLSN